MNRTLMTLAAAVLAIPTLAAAEPKIDPGAPTSPAVATKATRYCVVETPTGSRLEQRTCKSLDAWLAEGFDPRAKK